MPRIPTYESQNQLQAVDTAQTRVDPRIQRSTFSDAKVQEKTALSSIFQEAGKVYGARYEASKRAQEAVEIAKTGADAMRYRDNLLAESQKIDNEEESLKFYQEGMSKFLEEKTGQINDPVLKAQTFETINRQSLQGEHELFNYGQQRRKSKAIASVQDGLLSLETAALKAGTTAEKAEIERQAATLLDTAASSGYIMPDEAQEGKAKFRQGVAGARIQNFINKGMVGAASAELSASQSYLGAKELVQYQGSIINESKRLKGETEAKIKQSSRIAQLELQKQAESGNAFNPEPYLSRMHTEDRLQAEIWLEKHNQKEAQLVDKMNEFRASPVVETAEDRKAAERVFITDVMSIPDTPENMQVKTEDFIRNTGYLPRAVKTDIERDMAISSFDEKGGKTGHDPELKVQSAQSIERLKALNQQAYRQVDAKLVAQAQQIMDYKAKGLPSAEAVRLTEKNIENVKANTEFFTQVIEEPKYNLTSKEAVNLMRVDRPLTPDWLLTADPVTGNDVKERMLAQPNSFDPTKERMMAEYSTHYANARTQGMTEELASESAKEAIKTKFGTSYINSTSGVDFGKSGEIMLLPPEKVVNWSAIPQAKILTSEKDRMEFIRGDFDTFLNSIGRKNDGVKEVYRIETDDITEKEFNEGMTPSYPITSLRVTQSGRYVVDVLSERWRPVSWR